MSSDPIQETTFRDVGHGAALNSRIISSDVHNYISSGFEDNPENILAFHLPHMLYQEKLIYNNQDI
jgi:hypothetical protein